MGQDGIEHALVTWWLSILVSDPVPSLHQSGLQFCKVAYIGEILFNIFVWDRFIHALLLGLLDQGQLGLGHGPWLEETPWELADTTSLVSV